MLSVCFFLIAIRLNCIFLFDQWFGLNFLYTLGQQGVVILLVVIDGKLLAKALRNKVLVTDTALVWGADLLPAYKRLQVQQDTVKANAKGFLYIS